MQQHKKCSKCGEIKPHDRFSKNRTGKDGLQSYCKDCAAEYSRRYWDENLEASRERRRRYREENLEAERERRRRYREENLEAVRERVRRDLSKKRSVSREVAVRIGEPWTEAEDGFVKTSDLTALEIAVELGRTYNSVGRRKTYLRKMQQA